MQSGMSVLVKSYLGLVRSFRRGRALTLTDQRERLEHFAQNFKIPALVQIEPVRVGKIAAEWIIPHEIRQSAVVYYLHGGAYCAGSLNTHRAFLGNLALVCGCKVLIIDYRLAPENPFPAALDDAYQAYRWLIEHHSAQKIIVAGDSAGGGLTLALMLKLRDDSIDLPAAGVLMAPWANLTCDDENYQKVGKKDVLLDQDRLKRNARMYAGDEDLKNPLISPIFANLSNLPPILIQVGTHDLLLGDARRIAANIEKNEGSVELSIWEKMMHGWQILGNMLPESHKAIWKINRFIEKNT